MSNEKTLELVVNNPVEGKKISWNKEELMNIVQAMTDEYTNLVYTDADIKQAKADRAKLNAMKKEISDRRIKIKKELMEPYNQFEIEVNEVVALIEKPVAMIDSQIKEYEKIQKQEKREKIEEYYRGSIGDYAEIITFEKLYDPKWLNASTTIKSAFDAIDEKIKKINLDMKAIDSLCSEKYKAVIKDFYSNCLDISKSLAESRRLEQIDKKAQEDSIREELARRAKIREENEKKAAEEQRAINAVNDAESNIENQINATVNDKADEENVSGSDKTSVQAAVNSKQEQATDPFAADEKIYKASFTVYGTREQLVSIKRFMQDNGIKFGKVE